jgi:hypothetical protein
LCCDFATGTLLQYDSCDRVPVPGMYVHVIESVYIGIATLFSSACTLRSNQCRMVGVFCTILVRSVFYI